MNTTPLLLILLFKILTFKFELQHCPMEPKSNVMNFLQKDLVNLSQCFSVKRGTFFFFFLFEPFPFFIFSIVIWFHCRQNVKKSTVKKSTVRSLIQQIVESSYEFEAKWTTYLLTYFTELFMNYDWFSNYFDLF